MKFQLVVLPQASRDLDLTLGFLASKSIGGANAWYRQWIKACRTLESSADSFGRAPEDADNEFTVQQLVFKTRRGLSYRILYRIVDRSVYVYHIRGPGQDFADDLDAIELPTN